MSEVKIDVKRLRELDALEQGGVDNWEWYSESLKELRKEEELDELVASYTDSILQVCSEEGDVEYPAGSECGHSILLGDAEDGVVELLNKFMRDVIESIRQYRL